MTRAPKPGGTKPGRGAAPSGPQVGRAPDQIAIGLVGRRDPQSVTLEKTLIMPFCADPVRGGRNACRSSPLTRRWRVAAPAAPLMSPASVGMGPQRIGDLLTRQSAR